MTTSESELIGLERRYWQAMKEKDVDTAVRLTDFPCVLSGPQGVRTVDRPTYESIMQSPDWRVDDFRMSRDANVRFLNDDVAVIAYELHEEMTVDGRPVVLDMADASTWVRREGGWRCAQHSESVLVRQRT